jgi:hypothetical protein
VLAKIADLQSNLASLSQPGMASSTLAAYALQGMLTTGSHGLAGTGGCGSQGPVTGGSYCLAPGFSGSVW